MLRTFLFWDLFWMVFFIALLHQIGAHFYIYWTVPLYDVFMHFLGGFWIGLVTLWLCFVVEYIPLFKKTNKAMLLATIGGVLIIGLGWEVFEFFIGLTTTVLEDRVDTIVDIIMDTIGAVAAFVYFKHRAKEHLK